MSVFEIVEGSPGQGKSLYTARLARHLLNRNRKWFEKSGIVRPIISNLKFSEKFEQEYNKDGNLFIRYWSNTDEICKARDSDIIWDEIATELDSRNYSNLTEELKRFLSQYRKRGCDIYANTQDFSMIDARARLMVTRVATLAKIFGSRDPSSTKPDVDRIYGMVFVRDVQNFREADQTKKKHFLIPTVFFIDRADIEIYDTRQDIEFGTLPPRKLRKQLEVYDGDDQTKPFTKVKYI